MDSLLKKYRPELDKAKAYNANEQWRIIALMTKISTEARLEGETLMKVLEGYFSQKGVPKVQNIKDFVCPNCGKTFGSQQALIGHGPNKCSKSNK